MKEEQLIWEQALPTTISACAFTGHRELGEDFSEAALCSAIRFCIERGCKTFYCGMAKGFDLLAAEKVIEEKKKNGEIRLVACVPFAGQADRLSEQDQKKYAEILKNADESHVLSEHYTKWCMAKRNEFMADRADVLIAYLNKDTGGTAYTVKYFKRKKKGYVFYL